MTQIFTPQQDTSTNAQNANAQNGGACTAQNCTNGKDAPTYAIALITYNRAKYLRYMLQSLAMQSCKDFALTIYDNASTDETPSVVKSFLDKLNINYVRRSQNVGAPKNYLDAFESATTDFVTILFDDDMLMPSYVEKIKDAIKNNAQSPFIATRAKIIKQNDTNDILQNCAQTNTNAKTTKILQYQIFERYIKDDYDIVCPSAAFNIKLMRQNGINLRTDIGKSGDALLFMELNTLNAPCIILEDELYLYRNHDGQDSMHWLYMKPLLRSPVFCMLQKRAPHFCKSWLKYITVDSVNALKIARYEKNEYKFLKSTMLLPYKFDIKMRALLFAWVYCKKICIKYTLIKEKILAPKLCTK